jgi:hypothetical protein
MGRPLANRKCLHCQAFFAPHPRSAGRQRYCAKPECRKASKAASQRRWLNKPANRNYFKDPAHVERVRQWREAHPGYWRRKASGPAGALQDSLLPQPDLKQGFSPTSKRDALQDSLFTQPAVLVGLIAHLTGLALQDDIEITVRRLQQLGRDILSNSPHRDGGISHAQTAHLPHPTATGPPPV